MVLMYYKRTLAAAEQNNNMKCWLPGAFCWWCWGTAEGSWCSRRKQQHTNKKCWLPGTFCGWCWCSTPEPWCSRRKQQHANKKGWLPAAFCWWCWGRYYNRTLVLQNKTRTRKVGYQGHFVDDAEVLQQNLGAAEQEQEQERLVTRGVLLMVLRYYNGTLMQQKKTTH